MSTTHLTFDSGSSGGRLLTAAAVFLLMQASAALAAQFSSNVSVVDERGVFTVTARFVVDQPPRVVMTVLTDYEQIPRFMPNVRTSIVRERGTGLAVVEQEAVSSMMLFSKRIHLELEIEEQADTLIFRDRCGQSFVRYQGAWRLSPEGNQTAITYELTAEPSFDVPGFILKHLLQRDAGEMLERLQREIAARTTTPGQLTSPVSK